VKSGTNFLVSKKCIGMWGVEYMVSNTACKKSDKKFAGQIFSGV
jgi:hypothetical protein